MCEEQHPVVSAIHAATEEKKIVDIDYGDGVVAKIVPIAQWNAIETRMANLEKQILGNMAPDEEIELLVQHYRDVGEGELADELEAFMKALKAGEITDPDELAVRSNALFAKGLEALPGHFVPALAVDPDDELKALTDG